MFEVTWFDCGAEVGTFDFDGMPEVGTVLADGVIVVQVVEFDCEGRTASVEVRYE
jgi:hypothetical protein